MPTESHRSSQHLSVDQDGSSFSRRFVSARYYLLHATRWDPHAILLVATVVSCSRRYPLPTVRCAQQAVHCSAAQVILCRPLCPCAPTPRTPVRKNRVRSQVSPRFDSILLEFFRSLPRTARSCKCGTNKGALYPLQRL